MNKKIRWGILSTANIGVAKVIPAMQKGEYCEITAIASRDAQRAENTAEKLGIKKAYDSYEKLLDDPDIDAVYNPLPNHLHVPWSLKAMEAGKHVLCEKPIALNAKEAESLLKEAEKNPDLKVMEAFMYRFHPQWKKAKELVEQGSIGEVKTLQSFFSYYNVDPDNIRNMADFGGGALMDIGCYCISFPRFIFNKEPQRVMSIIDYDPDLKTDRITSGILDFSLGLTSTFTCSTQLIHYQHAIILGTEGLIDIEIPVNAPPDKPVKILLKTADETKEIVFDPVNQYTIQGDAFSKAILENKDVPTPLNDAVNNMKVIDAIIESVKKNKWVEV